LTPVARRRAHFPASHCAPCSPPVCPFPPHSFARARARQEHWFSPLAFKCSHSPPPWLAAPRRAASGSSSSGRNVSRK
jgi:hypothetical protein